MNKEIQSSGRDRQSCDRQIPSQTRTLGQFALVAYIPDPLARFLDDLRLELTPGCKPHAHVTVLPPRSLNSDLKEMAMRIDEDVRLVAPFRIELGEIEVFEASHVVYVGLAKGEADLRQLYKSLNCGCLEYAENFPYHPHITIAQDLLPEEASRSASVAREKWAAYRGPRGFTVNALSFVRNTAPSIWEDVAVLALGLEVPVGG